MRVKTLIGAALVLAMAPGLASAEFNYTTFDLRYVDLELDGVDANGDGYEIAGSYGLNHQFFLFGSYEVQDFDFGVDGDQIEAGFGYNHSFSPNLDFVATGSLLRHELSFAGMSVDDDAMAVGAGVRARPADPFEVQAGLKYMNYDESDDDTGLELLGRWYFTPSMALSLGMDIYDDVDSFHLGFRAEF